MDFKTTVYERLEIILHSDKEYENPFMDVDIDAVFSCEDGTQIALPGFWNGENEWKVRFSPNKAGAWTYVVTCTDQENTSLTDKGTIEAAPCVNPKTELQKHGYVRIEPGKRYLVYDDGTPFFYLGDTHWQMPDYEHIYDCNYPGCNCGSSFKHIVKNRLKKGFNVYQTYFASHRRDVSSSGMESWWKTPYKLINPDAFNKSMDVIVEYLAENGITIALGFGLHTALYNFFREQMTQGILHFARYCVARYACYPLIWITGQEITDRKNGCFEAWKAAGNLVGELDGYHRPNGAHMYPMRSDDSRAQELYEAPWHQWWTLQSGHGGYKNLQKRSFYESYYKLENVKPYIEAEAQYEDIYCEGFCGHNATRMSAWIATLSGSAGYTYGVSAIWLYSWEGRKSTYSGDAWHEAIDKPGSTQMTYLKKFYEYVNWYKLTPSFDSEFGMFEARKYITISHIDKDLIIYYFYGKEKETGYLRGLKKNTRYQARWYDPVCGKFIDLPDVVTDTGKADIPERPAERDFVLLLNTVDLGAYEAYTYPTNKAPLATKDVRCGEKLEIRNIRVNAHAEGHPAENLLDGSRETCWKAAIPDTSHTFDIDLGTEQEVGYLHIGCDLPEHRTIEFRVFGSNDGENYDLYAERFGNRVAIGGEYKDYYEEIDRKCRYIKLFIFPNETGKNLRTDIWELSEISVYKKP